MSGFSLIEVVIASAVLALICASASSVFFVALRSLREQMLRERVESALAQELARLESLPYWGKALGDSSLLGEVFPHADTARNTDHSFFIPSDEQGIAVFVTVAEVSGVTVRRTASFISLSHRGVYSSLPLSQLIGWSASGGASPPSCAVSIVLECTQRNRIERRRIVLSWLRPSLGLLLRWRAG